MATAAPVGAGVTFPRRADGERPSTPTCRSVLAEAARAVRPALGERIEGARDWRHEYARFVRELTAESAASPAASLAIARAGLESLRERVVVDRDGEDLPLAAALAGDDAPWSAATVRGGAAAVTELRVPYRGEELSGGPLLDQLERWVRDGVIEPSAAQAVRGVAAHPEWLRLEGRRVAVVGAASEMGPLAPLTAWGAHVIALDLPREALWRRVEAVARAGAGTVTMPVGPDPTAGPGIDLLNALPATRAWLEEAAGDDELVLGMYAYADGGVHVRLTAAFDALAGALLAARPGTALAYLATPTDAFVVPEAAVAAAQAAWRSRRVRRVAQAPLRAVTGGRLFAPAYADGTPVADVLVPQQGPNYAVAKRLQRWRALAAVAAGHVVSSNVAPASWTRSVTRNRVLAAAYAGARRFGIEIFAPETSRVLMAALLVHDLHTRPDADRHPEGLFADGAVHGGLWRAAYEPRSVLGLAAVAGALRSRSVAGA